MNDRLFTLVGGMLALLLVFWLFGGGEQHSAPPVSRPTTQDTGPAGLLGLYRWLESSAVPVHRLHQRYTALDEVAPGTGNLLVVLEPMVWPVRPTESPALHRWVERGNHVLLLSNPEALAWGQSDATDALGLQRSFLPLKTEAGKGQQLAPRLASRREACSEEALTRGTIAGPQRRLRVPGTVKHPVMRGVDEVLVKTAPPGEHYYMALGYGDRVLRHWYALLCDPQLRLPVFTAFRVGHGRVWGLDYSETFSNDNLDRGHNARLFANLAGFALGPGGRVVFDDMHQGDSELYDPVAFFSDSRTHGTLAFLGGMWLLWLLGYNSRFAPPQAAPPRVTSRAFVRAVGRFQARYLRPVEAARGLLRQFFNDTRQRYRLPTTGEPAWDALERARGRADPDLRQLRAWHARVQQGQPVDLAQLRNLILKVQDSKS